MKARIHVTLKPGVLDPAGQAVRGGLHALGWPEVAGVRIGRFFDLELPESPDAEAKIRRMCDQFLANPVIEEYQIEILSEGSP